MSGIEIVGLALGVFPIAIYTFEQYRLANVKIRRWRRIVETYYTTLNRLEHQRVRLQLHLRELLIPLVLDGALNDTQLNSLLAGTDVPQWKDADVDAALKRRLSSSHAAYTQLLKEPIAAVAIVWNALGADTPEFRTEIEQRVSISTPAMHTSGLC